MAKIKGICKNYDECDLASEKVVQEAEKTNFVCKECGKPLYAVPGGGNTGSGPNKGLLAAIAAVVVLGGGVGGYFAFSGDDAAKKEPVVVEPAPQKPEPVQEPVAEPVGEPVDEPKNTPQPAPSQVVTKDLGYAVWTGKMKNGKMHDTQGTLTFKSTHVIDSRDDKQRTANAGDKVIGTFENGHLVQGRWYKSDGNSESIILGSAD